MAERALVFGASGQIGSYLCEFLVQKGYSVFGTRNKTYREIEGVDMRLVDVTRPHEVNAIVANVKPDEVYNMASLMYAPDSWQNPREYFSVNAFSVVGMLDAVFKHNPAARFFQAGSAEVFSNQTFTPQDETTAILPRNPYGVAKAAAQDMVRVYREYKCRFACTGIFFNAESPRRKETFFARKVTKAVADIVAGKRDALILGCLGARRDWGLAEEYVEAAWLMLQAMEPADYVIGTGELHSCYEFVMEAFNAAGIDRVGDYLRYDNYTSAGYDVMQANPRKICEKLGWQAKTKFHGLVRYLVSEEMNTLGQSPVAR